jgi:hypothetical protein
VRDGVVGVAVVDGQVVELQPVEDGAAPVPLRCLVLDPPAGTRRPVLPGAPAVVGLPLAEDLLAPADESVAVGDKSFPKRPLAIW